MRRAILVCLLFAFGCRDATSVDDRWARPETIQYAASLNVDLTKMTKTASGLYWVDLVVGEADSAKVGDNVRVHFTGWYPDGTQFETTRDGAPVEFPLGVGLVIRGFDEGVVGMRVGGIRRLVIRPELAFGANGRDQVPPATTVIVEIERLTTPAH